jgi:hypothetical protein
VFVGFFSFSRFEIVDDDESKKEEKKKKEKKIYMSIPKRLIGVDGYIDQIRMYFFEFTYA